MFLLSEQTIEALVEGGAASAGPPLGPALGPMGVNIGQVIGSINEKTADFKGMKVPVKVIIDTETKTFDIRVGSPSVSQLIKKELKLEKGSSKPGEEYVADMKIEQAIKIAKMKKEALFTKGMKEAVKIIVGTCTSMGILVEGKHPKELIEEINQGKYAKEIASEKTELTEEELKKLEEEKKTLAEEIEKRKEEHKQKAKEIIGALKGKDNSEIKARLKDEKIPEEIIKELLPSEGEAVTPEEKTEEKQK